MQTFRAKQAVFMVVLVVVLVKVMLVVVYLMHSILLMALILGVFIGEGEEGFPSLKNISLHLTCAL